ncbi:winged helix-turn-helix domain-containing protein [Micromonospora sp. DT47]|uniref:winged helix-turn-helix domain-containing protein n=1 Tax=Micromonospora sp. DT47 TaxID=3393431 RepID=UPI003CF33AA0
MDGRVLLIEDDASIREVTALGLRRAGFWVSTAVDGRAALAAWRAQPVDLLVLDVLWNHSHLGDSRLVDVAMQRLRATVEDDPAAPRPIRTVRGVGYQLSTG